MRNPVLQSLLDHCMYSCAWQLDNDLHVPEDTLPSNHDRQSLKPQLVVNLLLKLHLDCHVFGSLLLVYGGVLLLDVVSHNYVELQRLSQICAAEDALRLLTDTVFAESVAALGGHWLEEKFPADSAFKLLLDFSHYLFNW